MSFGRRRPVPALEGAAAEGAPVAVPEPGAAVPSALDQVLAAVPLPQIDLGRSTAAA